MASIGGRSAAIACPPEVRSLIEDEANSVLVSAVTSYELDNTMRIENLDLEPQELQAPVIESDLHIMAASDPHAEPAVSFDGIAAIHGTAFSPPRHGYSIAP